MSSSREPRVVWKCPECSRNFRILKSKPRPTLCSKCMKKAANSVNAPPGESPEDDEMYFAEAEPAKPSSLKFGVAVESAAVEPAAVEREAERSAPQAIPKTVHRDSSVEELSDRLDEVLEHLEGITRTMKLMRWGMWSIGIATLLSIVMTVVGLVSAMSMIGSLGNLNLLNQPGGAALPGAAREDGAMPDGDAAIPPQLQQVLKVFGEQSQLRDELLKEIDQ